METELQQIPGIGKSMERFLQQPGYTTVASPEGQDPKEMYARSCEFAGGSVDRCVLYVYRCAVYCAENDTHAPEKRKWWNWNDT